MKAGGTLYTSGWGLARDEANQPLAALQAVLGLKSRTEPEMWCTVRRYGASGLGTFQGAKPAPDGAEVKGEGMFKASFKPLVGREALDPSPGTEVLARFADGTAAVTRNRFGKGQAWVVGFFPGLEYAAEVHRADFDMSRDFDPGKRSYVAAPIQTRPVVDAAQPLVEGILVRNGATGKRAVCLMNWAYKGRDLVPCENLAVTIRGAGPISKVTAAWLDKPLPITQSPDAITVTLPRLDEGEVLLID